jgi:hypothetical protein
MPIIEGMAENENPVRHDGEYVLTRAGDKDFGEIAPDLAQKIRRQPGKIRLRIGEQREDGSGHGEVHIERPIRMNQLKQNGYSNARDFVEEIARDYDAIYQGRGAALLLTKQAKKLIVVKLTPSSDEDFYDIDTAYVSRPIKKRRSGKSPKAAFITLKRYRRNPYHRQISLYPQALSRVIQIVKLSP